VCGQLFRRESCPRGFVVRGWLAGSIPPPQQIFEIVQGLAAQRFRQRQVPTAAPTISLYFRTCDPIIQS